MAETSLDAYAVTDTNIADTVSNEVAVVNDGIGNRQIVAIGAGDGTTTLIETSPTKRLRIQQDGTQIFYEAWDAGTVETVYNWNAAVTSGGTSTPTAGNLALASGTAANSYAYLTSKTKFQPESPGFLESDFQMAYTFAIPAHTYAFWGVANVPASPTATAMLTDSVNFEIAIGGKMYAVCWAGGVRNQIQDLSSTGNNTQPLDANVHRYQIYMRGDTVYWLIDNATVATILTGALGPNTNLLPIAMGSGVDATGASSALTINNAAVYMADTTKSDISIVDRSHPQYAATIKPPSTAAVAADGALVTAFHPSSPLPAGASIIGALTANQSVNNAQISGTTTSVSNGTTDAGTQRVTLSSDSTGQVKLATGANVIGSISNTSFTASNTAGDVANGSTDSGNPVKQGAVAHTAAPTAVTDGQRVNLIADKVGKQVVVGSIRDLKGNQFTTITSSTSETTVVTAVASTFLDVYGCIVENTSATASKVTFKDSTAGTTQFEIYVPAGDTRGFMLPESGGFKQTTVNTNWTATAGTSVASIVISMLYVKNI